MLRIHLLAVPWGSMHRGHRRPWSTAMAFSEEKSSLGRPQIFHCLIFTGSPKAADRLNLGLQGTPAASQAATQPARQSDLCTEVKGPADSTSQNGHLPTTPSAYRLTLLLAFIAEVTDANVLTCTCLHFIVFNAFAVQVSAAKLRSSMTANTMPAVSSHL